MVDGTDVTVGLATPGTVARDCFSPSSSPCMMWDIFLIAYAREQTTVVVPLCKLPQTEHNFKLGDFIIFKLPSLHKFACPEQGRTCTQNTF